MIFYLFFSLFFLTSSLFAETENSLLKVNLFCEANGKGLEKDRIILKEALEDLNVQVNVFDPYQNMDIEDADINIFVQNLNGFYFSRATFNWFIPNPEWYYDPIELLNSIDLILCRTHEVQRIFSELKHPTYYLSFTSEDHYQPEIQKNSLLYLHLAGSSDYKGSKTIKSVWSKHPNFPFLTLIKQGWNKQNLNHLKIVNQYIPIKSLIKLQNSSMVHLCLSETEGFGHYIMEAMSTGAVVLTTNAPPMNEFIKHPECLIEANSHYKQQLANCYQVDPEDCALKIQNLQKLTKKELKKIGKSNRKRFLKINDTFRKNLKYLINVTKNCLKKSSD